MTKNLFRFIKRNEVLYYLALFIPVVLVMWGSFAPGFLFSLDSQFTPNYNIKNLDLAYDLGIIKYLLWFGSNVLDAKFLQILYFCFCLYFPAGISFFYLRKYFTTTAAFVGALFLLWNPFVYERFIAGHLHIILALGFVVPFVHYLIKTDTYLRNIKLIVIILFSSIITFHALWFLLVPLSINFLLKIKNRQVDWKPLIAWLLIAFGEFVIISLKATDEGKMLIIPFYTVSAIKLFVFEGMWIGKELGTSSTFGFNPIFNIIGWIVLYGLLFCGLIKVIDFNKFKFDFAAIVIITGLIGLFFSLLSIEEFSELYEGLFHIPGFGIMREGHKWLSLYLICFSVLISSGTEFLLRRYKPLKLIVTTILVGVVIALTFKFSFLASGQVKVQEYPTTWQKLEELSASQDGSILVLPWTGYGEYKFVQGMFIADPTRLYFSKPVISSRFPENMNYLNKCDIQDLNFCINFGDSSESWKEYIREQNISYILINKLSHEEDEYDFLKDVLAKNLEFNNVFEDKYSFVIIL